jgi:hypothetical protein
MSLYVRIRHRFGPRQMEWFMAGITLAWGLVLLLPIETFNTPTWSMFDKIAPEWGWGGLMAALGFARLAGLLINGSLPVATPWIRVVSAAIGFCIWVLVCFNFAVSGVVSTWLAVYPALALAECVNIYRAAHDVGEQDAIP